MVDTDKSINTHTNFVCEIIVRSSHTHIYHGKMGSQRVRTRNLVAYRQCNCKQLQPFSSQMWKVIPLVFIMSNLPMMSLFTVGCPFFCYNSLESFSGPMSSLVNLCRQNSNQKINYCKRKNVANLPCLPCTDQRDNSSSFQFV